MENKFKIHISDTENIDLDQNESGGNSPNFLLLIEKKNSRSKIEPVGVKPKEDDSFSSKLPRRTLQRKGNHSFKPSEN